MKTAFKSITGLFLLLLAVHTAIRIVRHYHKFPIPEWMANAIDNPLRRRIQPPAQMPLRHGIEAGMRILEVGPGNGRYTIELARRAGPTGYVTTIDIEPKMIARVAQRAKVERIANVEARVANVYDLPFDDGSFDAVSLIAVIGEIPDPELALREFYRVLTPGGLLAFSELLPDPDYPQAATLTRLATAAGFRSQAKIGNWIAYTLRFTKP